MVLSPEFNAVRVIGKTSNILERRAIFLWLLAYGEIPTSVHLAKSTVDANVSFWPHRHSTTH